MSQGKAAFSDETRTLILERCNGRCEICGGAAEHGQFHHRSPRRMGGTKRESLGKASNAMYLHYQCHERVERDRTKARESGWIMYDIDAPTDIPVLLWDGWCLLSDDGSVIPCPPEPER